MKGNLCFFKKIIATCFASAFAIKASCINCIRMPGYKNIIAKLAIGNAGFGVNISSVNIGKFLFGQAFQVMDRRQRRFMSI